MVRWNETFIIGENSFKCWFSVNTSNKFIVVTTNFDVQKWKWAKIFLFNGEVYILILRGHLFVVKGISKNDFHDLLNLATKKSFFTFNNKFYIQVDVVAVGSPLVPILANIFLSHPEEKWLNKCPIEFKSKFYRSYVDDIFVLFESSESASSFREYMSSKYQNIKPHSWTGKSWLTFVFRRQNLL